MLVVGSLRRRKLHIFLYLAVALLLFNFLPFIPFDNSLLLEVRADSTLFSDDFETYAVGASNSAYDPCLGPPDNSPTCVATPYINSSPIAPLPQYWQLASSGTCAQNPATGLPPGLGGCVTWGDFTRAGPNSIFSVVRERAYTGSQSLKLGASDYAFDKSEALVWLDPNAFAATGTLNFTHAAWFSNGINNDENHYQFDVGGLIMRYVGSYCRFGVQNVATRTFNWAITNLCLTTQTWHVFTILVDLASKTLDDVIIDGISYASNVQGQGAGSWHTLVVSQKTAVAIGTWINPGISGQSINGLGQTSGFYAYIDSYGISQSASTFSGTSTKTSSSATSSVSSSSSTTALPIFAGMIFAFMELLVSIGIGYGTIWVIRKNRNRKRRPRRNAA